MSSCVSPLPLPLCSLKSRIQRDTAETNGSASEAMKHGQSPNGMIAVDSHRDLVEWNRVGPYEICRVPPRYRIVVNPATPRFSSTACTGEEPVDHPPMKHPSWPHVIPTDSLGQCPFRYPEGLLFLLHCKFPTVSPPIISDSKRLSHALRRTCTPVVVALPEGAPLTGPVRCDKNEQRICYLYTAKVLVALNRLLWY